MPRWGWIAIAALGCSSRAGLAIDVDLGGAASAELLAPVKPCADCMQGIAPPGAPAALVGRGGSGDVTYLDSPTRVLAMADKNGHAHFELQAGATDPIPKLLVVGFDANDKATGTYAELDDVDVPEQSGVVWDVKLAHAPAGKQLLAWRQPEAPCGASPTHASCVGIADTGGAAAFYVPEDDPDCDGCTGASECDDYWYLDQQTNAPCFTERSIGSGSASACEAGSGTCVDGAGPTQMSCDSIANTVCVPNAVCGNGTCFRGISGCLTVSPLPQSYLMLQCSLLVDVMDAGNGEVAVTPCAGSMGSYELPVPLPQCVLGGFAAPITSTTISSMPTAMLTSSALDAQRSNAMTTINATATAGCSLDLGWSGTLTFQSDQVPPTIDPLYVVVDALPGVQLVLPMSISIDTSQGCVTSLPPIHCTTAASSDPEWACGL